MEICSVLLPRAHQAQFLLVRSAGTDNCPLSEPGIPREEDMSVDFNFRQKDGGLREEESAEGRELYLN